MWLHVSQFSDGHREGRLLSENFVTWSYNVKGLTGSLVVVCYICCDQVNIYIEGTMKHQHTIQDNIY